MLRIISRGKYSVPERGLRLNVEKNEIWRSRDIEDSRLLICFTLELTVPAQKVYMSLTINKRETWEIFIEILPLYLVLIYLYPDAYHSNIWEFVISYLVIL